VPNVAGLSGLSIFDCPSVFSNSLFSTTTFNFSIIFQKTTFFIGDLGDVIKKYKLWQTTFPRIEPSYGNLFFN